MADMLTYTLQVPMLRRIVLVAAFAQFSTSGAFGSEARLIVQFKSDADIVVSNRLARRRDAAAVHDVLQRRAAALGLKHGIALEAGRALSERMQVVRAVGIDSATLEQVLAADPHVESVQVDRRVRVRSEPNDPLYDAAPGLGLPSGQWYLKPPGADAPAGIDAPAAWALVQGHASPTIAVLDTGVRFDHPDLQGRLLAGRDMVADVGRSADGDGRDADPSDPGDWSTDGDLAEFSDCKVERSTWHGTMVSSLLAAITGDGVGMAGLVPDAKILPVRVLGKCGGWVSDIMAGMRWAAGLSVPGEPDNAFPAKVLNLSLGWTGSCAAANSATVSEVVRAGVVIVAASANDNGHEAGAPTNCPGVIAVGGVNHTGTKASYSAIDPVVTISAPSGDCPGFSCAGEHPYRILVATNTGATVPVPGRAGAGHAWAAGNSFATPLVAGTVALMMAVDPTLTPARTAALLQSSARPFPSVGDTSGIGFCQAAGASDQGECLCTTDTCGAGMLDAGAAVHAALPTTRAAAPSPSADHAALDATGGGGAISMGSLFALVAAVAALALRRL